jgi:hypothetical protein
LLISKAKDALLTIYGTDFKTALSIAQAMSNRQLDEIDFRKETTDTSGLIGWLAGNQMIDSGRKLLMAAAKATSQPRKRYANAQSVVAEEFLSKCLMGQTRVGSYIITALVPSAEIITTSRARAAQNIRHTVTGRDVTTTLIGALEAVQEATTEARRTDSLASFEEKVSNGVSLEFLTSLEGITSQTETQVRVEQHKISETPDSHDYLHAVSRDFYFTPSDSLEITRARELFSSYPAPQTSILSGEVVLLKNSVKVFEHEIKLQALVEGRVRPVTVHLDGNQYGLAIEAHSGGRQFQVRGYLEEHARSLSMDVPDEVRILSEDVIK